MAERGFFYPGPVPTKELCPRCGGPMDGNVKRRPRSRIRYGDRRPITICHDCGMEEAAAQLNGQTLVPDTEWPLNVRRPLTPPEHQDDIHVEFGEEGAMSMSGEIRDPKILKLVEEGQAQGRSVEDVMNDILNKGVQGLKDMYDER